MSATLLNEYGMVRYGELTALSQTLQLVERGLAAPPQEPYLAPLSALLASLQHEAA